MNCVQPLLAALFAAASLLPAAGARAEVQYYDDIDAASRIGDEHVTRLQRESVTRFGELLRFEVKVAWKDPAARPDTEAPIRIVRYLAKCPQKELAVAAVAVFDPSNRMVKSFGIPPGGWEYAPAKAGSPQAEWLEKACNMPV